MKDTEGPTLWSFASGTEYVEGEIISIHAPLNREGFICIPSINPGVSWNGWFLPIDENNPIGTPLNNTDRMDNRVNINKPGFRMLATEHALIADNDELPFGCMDWIGQRVFIADPIVKVTNEYRAHQPHYLQWKGPRSRYQIGNIPYNKNEWLPGDECLVYSTEKIGNVNYFFSSHARVKARHDGLTTYYQNGQGGDLIFYRNVSGAADESMAFNSGPAGDPDLLEPIYGNAIWYLGKLVARAPQNEYGGYTDYRHTGGQLVGHSEQVKGCCLIDLSENPNHYRNIEDEPPNTKTKWLVVCTTEWWCENMKTGKPVYSKLRVYIRPLGAARADAENSIYDQGIYTEEGYNNLLTQYYIAGDAVEKAEAKNAVIAEYGRWRKIGEFDVNGTPATHPENSDIWFGESEPIYPMLFNNTGTAGVMNISYFDSNNSHSGIQGNPEWYTAEGLQLLATTESYALLSKRMRLTISAYSTDHITCALDKDYDVDGVRGIPGEGAIDSVIKTVGEITEVLTTTIGQGSTKQEITRTGRAFLAADYMGGGTYAVAYTDLLEIHEIEHSTEGQVLGSGIASETWKNHWTKTEIIKIPYLDDKGRVKYNNFVNNQSIILDHGGSIAVSDEFGNTSWQTYSYDKNHGLDAFIINNLDLRHESLAYTDNLNGSVVYEFSSIANNSAINVTATLHNDISTYVQAPGISGLNPSDWVYDDVFTNVPVAITNISNIGTGLSHTSWSFGQFQPLYLEYRTTYGRHYQMDPYGACIRTDWRGDTLLGVEKYQGVTYTATGQVDTEIGVGNKKYYNHYTAALEYDYVLEELLGLSDYTADTICLLNIDLA